MIGAVLLAHCRPGPKTLNVSSRDPPSGMLGGAGWSSCAALRVQFPTLVSFLSLPPPPPSSL